MKCKFVFDVSVDPSTMDEESKKLIRYRAVKRPSGKVVMEPYFPSGTEYEHPAAAMFVTRGMAVPADEECLQACPNLTESELQRLQLNYQADALGIADKEDRELFFAGVIAGYEQVNGRTAYLPGPNWQPYKDAQDKLKGTKKPDNRPEI